MPRRRPPGGALPPLLIAVCAATTGAACADDGNLGKGFVPRDGDTTPSSGPAFPIAEGATLHWSFSRTYDPSIVNTSTTNEKQVAGALCLRITEVDDRYASGEETLVAAQTRLSDATGAADVFYADQNDPEATWQAVDGTHVALWLTALLPPTRGHGMVSAVERSYGTRRSIAPPQGPGQQLFFDPRQSDSGPWDGWASYAADFFAHFRDLFGAGFASSDDLHLSPPRSAYGCTGQQSSSACATAGQGCLWDGLTCAGLFSLEATWREDAPALAPAGLAGATLMHHVRVDANEDGSLRTIFEVVRVDEDGGTPVSEVATAYHGCGGTGTACATSTMELIAAPWGATTPCRF